ncbi:MAG: pilus assembly protein PilM [Planctomycetaceae bacterium]|nr:pilus assembly protein PilM [Planctomycetaceae bacterium]
MAKIIAIEWDRKELRLLAGSRRGTQIHVENAVAVAMPATAEGDNTTQVNATEAIGQALNKLRLAKGEAVLSVGRAHVELRTLQLPKVDADDLPDMVRFQALKQFAGLTESTPIDYVVLPENASSSEDNLSILAVALNQAAQKEMQKQAADAGLEIQKVVLRPFAVAHLLSLADGELSKQNLLMVDILGDEADLTIVEKGCVVFIRSVKLPSTDESVVGQWLVGEMRRTLMAAAGQRNGLKVDQVVVWAQQSVADSLSDRAAAQLQLPIQVIDPFNKVKMDDEAKKSLQDSGKSRFTPLLGVLIAEAAGTKHDIDFMNPKRRPPKEKPIARYVLMATAAASVVLGGFYLYFSSHWALDAEIAALSAQSKDMDDMVQVAQQNTRRWKSVESFIDKEVNWLDEMERISNELPPASEVIIREANFALNSRGANLATISANGLTKDKDTHKKIEEKLRLPPYYLVAPKTSSRILQKIEGLEEYSWAFDGDMTLTKKPPKVAPAAAADKKNDAVPAEKEAEAPKSTDKPAEEKPAPEKASDDKSTEEKSDVEKTNEEKPAPATPESDKEKAAAEPILTDSKPAGESVSSSDTAG